MECWNLQTGSAEEEVDKHCCSPNVFNKHHYETVQFWKVITAANFILCNNHRKVNSRNTPFKPQSNLTEMCAWT